jgi:hypothetical protein
MPIDIDVFNNPPPINKHSSNSKAHKSGIQNSEPDDPAKLLKTQELREMFQRMQAERELSESCGGTIHRFGSEYQLREGVRSVTFRNCIKQYREYDKWMILHVKSENTIYIYGPKDEVSRETK